MGIGVLLKTAAKWLGPKVLAGLAKSGKLAAKGYRTYNAYVVPKIQHAIRFGGSKVASVVKNPTVRKSLLAATKLASSDKVVGAIVKDLTFKGVKGVTTKLPGGQIIRPVMDAADTFIGIPLI